MNPLPSVVLLDLDDTILRFSTAGDETWRDLCRAFAPGLGVSIEDLRDAIERSAREYWSDPARHRIGRLDLMRTRRHIVGGAFRELQLDAIGIAAELADRFTIEREDRVCPFPSSIETLQRLRDGGRRLGLLTNGSSEFQRRKIERFKLDRFFEVILIEGEIGFGKPDHRVFQRALAELRATPTEACMIGDNLEWDIEPAQQLGILDVWVDHDGKGLPRDCPITPTHAIDSLGALAGLL